MPRLYYEPKQVAADSEVFFPHYEKPEVRPSRGGFDEAMHRIGAVTNVATGPVGELAIAAGKRAKWAIEDMARKYAENKAAEAYGKAGETAVGEDFTFDPSGRMPEAVSQSGRIGATMDGEVNVSPLDERHLAERAGWTQDPVEERLDYDPRREVLAQRTQLRRELGEPEDNYDASFGSAAAARQPVSPESALTEGDKRDIDLMNRLAVQIPPAMSFYGKQPSWPQETQPGGPQASMLPQPQAEASAPNRSRVQWQTPVTGEAATGVPGYAVPQQAAAPAPAAARPATLSTVSDEELTRLRDKLTQMAAQNPDNPVLRQRLDLLLRETEHRAFVKNREPAPLTEDEFIAMARTARTPEEQRALLARVGEVRSRYSNPVGMLGTGEAEYLRKNAEQNFPSLPKLTPEQIAADTAWKLGKAHQAEAAGVQAKAKAAWFNTLAPAQKAKLLAEGDKAISEAFLAGERGVSEENRRGLMDAQAKDLASKAKERDDLLTHRITEYEDKHNKALARIAAIRAAQRAGGGVLKPESAKELKQLIDGVQGMTKEASEHYKAVLADTEKDEAVARAQVERYERTLPPAGERPDFDPATTPSRDRAKIEERAAKWDAEKQAYDIAQANLPQAKAALLDLKTVREKAFAKLQEAQAEAAPLQTIVKETTRRLAKQKGIALPEEAKPEEPSLFDKAKKLFAPAPAAASAPAAKRAPTAADVLE